MFLLPPEHHKKVFIALKYKIRCRDTWWNITLKGLRKGLFTEKRPFSLLQRARFWVCFGEKSLVQQTFQIVIHCTIFCLKIDICSLDVKYQ